MALDPLKGAAQSFFLRRDFEVGQHAHDRYDARRKAAAATLDFLRGKSPTNWKRFRGFVTDNFRIISPKEIRVMMRTGFRPPVDRASKTIFDVGLLWWIACHSGIQAKPPSHRIGERRRAMFAKVDGGAIQRDRACARSPPRILAENRNILQRYSGAIGAAERLYVGDKAVEPDCDNATEKVKYQ